ncbi:MULTISPECIES: flagellin N-terminal helical domain-containing protein [Clostridium]|jgi:flagellin-like hook-associated protein FlgL|uniref:flagellin N-terminal helical domain-containing protein n=1 Tax=Clostridium TaxID=1485 RepID=UPI00242CDE29|nr:flagellin [Clostridium tyrobutyricum]
MNNSIRNLREINRLGNYVDKSVSRLSTGKRINSAADSPSDMGRINGFTAQIRGSQVGQRNIQDGTSYLQVKENAVNEMQSVGQRLNELSVQYRNDTLNSDDKKMIEKEATELLKNVIETKEQTKFNGLNVFDNKDINIQTGANAGENIIIKHDNIDISMNSDNTFNLHSKDKSIKRYELTNNNIDDFLKIYKTSDAKILATKTQSFSFDCKVNLSDGKKSNIHFNAEKMNPNSYVVESNELHGYYLYNVKGIFLDDNSKEIVGSINNNSKAGIFNTALSIVDAGKSPTMNDALYMTTSKIGTVDNIKDLTSLSIAKSGSIGYEDIPIKVSNFAKTDKEFEIQNEEFKNMINNSNVERKIRITYSNREDANINIKDGKAYLETISETPAIKKFDIASILSNPDLLNDNLIKPLNKERSYIGIKTNELERKLDFGKDQKIINTSSLSKIEDADMAKELMEKSRNELLLNINYALLAHSLDNDRQNILQLLR